jgi:hypothetical protein
MRVEIFTDFILRNGWQVQSVDVLRSLDSANVGTIYWITKPGFSPNQANADPYMCLDMKLDAASDIEMVIFLKIRIKGPVGTDPYQHWLSTSFEFSTAAVVNDSNNVEIFFTGQQKRFLCRRSYNSTFESSVQKEYTLDDLRSSPSVISLQSGQIDILYQGVNHLLLHRCYKKNGTLISATMASFLISAPAVVSRDTESCEVFYVSQNKHLWFRSFNTRLKWSQEQDIGGILTSAPTAVSRSLDHMEVFYRGQNGHLWHRWWKKTGNMGYDFGDWSAEEDLGGILISSPAAVALSPSHMEVYYVSSVESRNCLFYRFWKANRGWSEELNLSQKFNLINCPPNSSPNVVFSRVSNRLHIFYRDENGHLRYFYRNTIGDIWSVTTQDLGVIP